MRESEARELAKKYWGGWADVSGEDSFIDPSDCKEFIVGRNHPGQGIWDPWTFEEYGRGATWDEAFADALTRHPARQQGTEQSMDKTNSVRPGMCPWSTKQDGVWYDCVHKEGHFCNASPHQWMDQAGVLHTYEDDGPVIPAGD